jgi:hypothetical protein
MRMDVPITDGIQIRYIAKCNGISHFTNVNFYIIRFQNISWEELCQCALDVSLGTVCGTETGSC